MAELVYALVSGTSGGNPVEVQVLLTAPRFSQVACNRAKQAKMKQKFSIQRRVQSFLYALRGFQTLLREEHNSRIHLVAAIAALVLSYALKISLQEWTVIVLCIGLVFVTEIFNTAIESLCDHVTPAQNEQIKKTKDLSAAAVLTAALTSVLVALFIFVPKILF